METPACIFCCSKGRQERHWLANCRRFLELAPTQGFSTGGPWPSGVFNTVATEHKSK